jgi:hypothetical protein
MVNEAHLPVNPNRGQRQSIAKIDISLDPDLRKQDSSRQMTFSLKRHHNYSSKLSLTKQQSVSPVLKTFTGSQLQISKDFSKHSLGAYLHRN